MRSKRRDFANLAPALAISLSLCALAPLRAAEGDSRAERNLVEAFLRTDFDGIAGSGHALSTRGLSKMMASSSPLETRAAIAAAPRPEDAWQLLLDLAVLAEGPDRSIAAPAARAAVEIAQRLDLDRVTELEIAPAYLRSRAAAWQRIALGQGKWPDVRVHALEVNTLLGRALSDKVRKEIAVELSDVAKDPEPEVRRATLELQEQPLDAKVGELAATLLRDDRDPVVAIVAGQTLCGGIAMGDAPARILKTLEEPGIQRLRNLIGNAGLPPVARIDAAYCLRAQGGTKNRRALSRLVSTSPRAVVREARALLRGTR